LSNTTRNLEKKKKIKQPEIINRVINSTKETKIISNKWIIVNVDNKKKGKFTSSDKI